MQYRKENHGEGQRQGPQWRSIGRKQAHKHHRNADADADNYDFERAPPGLMCRLSILLQGKPRCELAARMLPVSAWIVNRG